MITIEELDGTEVQELPMLAIIELHNGDIKPKLRKIPQTWLEHQDLSLEKEPDYLIIREDGSKEIAHWFNGWNCFLRHDDKNSEWYISRKRELTDVIAWAELPDYIPAESSDGDV